MAKKKNQKLSRSKDYQGCMSGLISFFDVRYGRSTQRLLSSRGHKNAESPDATGDKKKAITSIQIRQSTDKKYCDDDAESANITMSSVKSLVEEGMMKMPKPKKKLNDFVIEQIKQDLGLDESSWKCHEEFIDKSGLAVKILPLVEEFITNRDYYNCMPPHRNCFDAQAHLKHSPERLREALERFLSHKHNEACKLKRDGAAQQADVVIDTIQTVHTYKDLFLRLLQDKKSVLIGHIEGSRHAQAKKVDHIYSSKEIKETVLLKNEIVDSRLECKADSQKPKIGYSRLFGRKGNKQEQNISGVSGGTTHHVLIMESSQTSARSRLSIEEFKKKLKFTIGEGKKERHWLFTTKMPNKQANISDSEESLVKTKTINKSPNVNLKDQQHQERDLMFYIEARKHLMEMLEIDDEEESPTALHIPKTLERIISSSDYISSSSFSPASNKASSYDEHLSYCGSMQLIPSNCESPLENILKLDNRSDVKPQEADFKPDSIRAMEVEIAEREELNAVKSISETVDDDVQELGDSVDTENSSNEKSLSTINKQNEEFLMDSEKNMVEEMHQINKIPALFSTSRVHIDSIDSYDTTVDKSARASPVSVLEPFSSDDTLETYTARTDGTFIQPRRILFDVQDGVFITSDSALQQATSPTFQKEEKAAAIEYVNKVLVISGLNSNKINGDWPFTYSPLDPSLMNHIEASSSQIPDFYRLLFDCINEVILELHKHINSCWPWISFVGVGIHLIPNRNQAIQKVLEGVAAYLATPGQDSVDQTIEKDMAKDRLWMNLCSDVEEVEFYIEDSILDKMMEEMILDLRG